MQGQILLQIPLNIHSFSSHHKAIMSKGCKCKIILTNPNTIQFQSQCTRLRLQTNSTIYQYSESNYETFIIPPDSLYKWEQHESYKQNSQRQNKHHKHNLCKTQEQQQQQSKSRLIMKEPVFVEGQLEQILRKQQQQKYGKFEQSNKLTNTQQHQNKQQNTQTYSIKNDPHQQQQNGNQTHHKQNEQNNTDADDKTNQQAKQAKTIKLICPNYKKHEDLLQKEKTCWPSLIEHAHKSEQQESSQQQKQDEIEQAKVECIYTISIKKTEKFDDQQFQGFIDTLETYLQVKDFVKRSATNQTSNPVYLAIMANCPIAKGQQLGANNQDTFMSAGKVVGAAFAVFSSLIPSRDSKKQSNQQKKQIRDRSSSQPQQIVEQQASKWQRFKRRCSSFNTAMTETIKPINEKVKSFSSQIGEKFESSDNQIVKNIREWSKKAEQALNQGYSKQTAHIVQQQQKANTQNSMNNKNIVQNNEQQQLQQLQQKQQKDNNNSNNSNNSDNNSSKNSDESGDYSDEKDDNNTMQQQQQQQQQNLVLQSQNDK